MSQSYYGSTDPQTCPGTSGQLTYSNFNAVNAPYMQSTGVATLASVTATSAVITAVSVTSQVIATQGIYRGYTAVTGGSSYPDSPNLTAYGHHIVASTSDCIKYYELGSPTLGSEVSIYCALSESTSPVYVYADSSSDNGAYFGSTANSTGGCLLSMGKGTHVTLVGLSTAQWIITDYTTANSTGLITIASSGT